MKWIDRIRYKINRNYKDSLFCINSDNQNSILNRCQPLKEYMIFVEKVRKYQYTKSMSIEKAVDLAIDECIAEKVLLDVLLQQKAEVRKMCITEFNEEVYKQGMKEEYEEEKAMLEAEIAEKKAEIAEKDAEILAKNAEIVRLKALLQNSRQ